MTDRRWDPIRVPLNQWPLNRLDEQIERAFDELLTAPWLAEPRGWLPQLDITETADEFIIDADLPGVGLDELQVEVEDRSVAIRGSRSDRRSESRQGIIHVERRHGSFCRRLTLRVPVDSQAIQITQEHGVIRIRLPKQRAQEQP